jgi:hypothetical protein
MKNIFSIFAKTSNIELLIIYLKRAIEMNIINEVHIWNYTCSIEDENRIQKISNIQRTTSVSNGKYIHIYTPFIDNHITFYVIAANDIHIKFLYSQDEYEIVIGAFSNTRSMIRINKQDKCVYYKKNITNEYQKIKIDVYIENNQVYVKINNKLFMCVDCDGECDSEVDNMISQICVKTGYGSVGYFYYELINNHGFYFMDTCDKTTYNDMYYHYSSIEHTDDVILTCNSEIVFIDLLKLPNFIEFIRSSNNNYNMVFPNIINNSIVGYYLQNKYNIIPKNIVCFEYLKNGCLLKSGPCSDLLHDFFLKNHMYFLNYYYGNEYIPIHNHFDTTFFGYKGSNWSKLMELNANNTNIHLDDIEDIYSYDDIDTINSNHANIQFEINNVLYFDLYVSHLSYFQKRKNSIDVWINGTKWIDKYTELCKKMMKTRFEF